MKDINAATNAEELEQVLALIEKETEFNTENPKNYILIDNVSDATRESLTDLGFVVEPHAVMYIKISW